MQQLAGLLAKAERPLAILGGSRWTPAAVDAFAAFATAQRLPVAVSFRRQMLFPHCHDCHVGDIGVGANPKLVERVKSADLIIMLGSRMGEMPSQAYTVLDIPVPRQAIVHVMPDAAQLGRVYTPTLAICATPTAFVEALSQLAPAVPKTRDALVVEARRDYLAWTDHASIRIPGPLQMADVMKHFDEVMPDDAILCNGAGNYATWVHRFHRFDQFGTQLAPTSGSMGYGVPAAVGAKRVQPERTVVAFAGDGCFLMNGQEFATAVQYSLPIIVIIVDNRMYGTIRMHQEREYPGRVSATTLRNPDFAAYARAFGGHGERVTTTAEFAPALARARESGLPAILHLILDGEAITPSTTLTKIRETAVAAGR
jgi:acetolactate synthase-1/2/3 large subunit